MYMGEYMFKSI